MSTIPTTITPDWIAERVRKHLPLWTFRCFHIRITNRKRQRGRGVEYCESYGVVFPSGHVVIDTNVVERKGYESMDDLMETLCQYGDVEVKELGEMSI